MKLPHGGVRLLSTLDVARASRDAHREDLEATGGRMPFETWGMFSVSDHLGPRAFVSDVVMYDRLVIPVPDAEERKRWIRRGRQPDVLERKLDILGDDLVERLDWTPTFRSYLDAEYPQQRGEARQDTINPAWADSLDRYVLADMMRSGRLGDIQTPEIVPAYTSYDAMYSDFKPSTVSADLRDRPDDRLVGVVGWEFLVPDDSTLDDNSLLNMAVRLAQDDKIRVAREAFHEFRREATRLGASPEQFLSELESKLREYQKATARAAAGRMKINTARAFAFFGAGLAVAAAIAAMPPVGLAAAFMGLASVGVDIGWRESELGKPPQAVAMFHDARKHFDWLE